MVPPAWQPARSMGGGLLTLLTTLPAGCTWKDGMDALAAFAIVAARNESIHLDDPEPLGGSDRRSLYPEQPHVSDCIQSSDGACCLFCRCPRPVVHGRLATVPAAVSSYQLLPCKRAT